MPSQKDERSVIGIRRAFFNDAEQSILLNINKMLDSLFIEIGSKI